MKLNKSSINTSLLRGMPHMAKVSTLALITTMGSTAFAAEVNIQSATGSGSHASYPPSNVIDGDTSFASRWAGNGSPEEVRLDLGSDHRIDDVSIAWGRGSSRSYPFEIAGRSGTSGSWTTVFSGENARNNDLQNYNVTDITARQIRIRGFRDGYTDITEVKIFDTGSGGDSGGSDSTSGGLPNSSGTYVFEKRNTAFSIDGRGGARIGQQVYLWNTNTGNANQQWDRLPVNNTFSLFRKAGTNVCLDGGAGGSRRQEVELQTCDANNDDQHWEVKSQTGGHVRLKKSGVNFSIDCAGGAERNQSCYLWNSSDSNVNQHFTMLSVGDSSGGSDTGGGDTGGGDTTSGGTGDFNLNSNDEPWENFDLREWKLDTPAGNSSASDCDAQDTEPQDWNNSFLSSRSSEFFFTHSDGGMRFISEYGGGTTGGDCRSKSRSELREMLRGSNTNIDTTGKNGDFRNNWALGSSNGEYQPRNADADETWGAREGRMRATLVINDVTESGSDNDQGNIVIGQIHASSDEPLRLHYRIRPGQTRGCFWAASEIREGDDVNFNIIGDRDCDTNNGPSNGIELGELFSYEIINDGPLIIVRIREGDRGAVIDDVTINLDTLNSGYDRDDEWNYFKAGVYSQNDDGDIGDRDIVTFYRLDVDH